MHARFFREVPRRHPNATETPLIEAALTAHRRAAREAWSAGYTPRGPVRPRHAAFLNNVPPKKLQIVGLTESDEEEEPEEEAQIDWDGKYEKEEEKEEWPSNGEAPKLPEGVIELRKRVCGCREKECAFCEGVLQKAAEEYLHLWTREAMIRTNQIDLADPPEEDSRRRPRAKGRWKRKRNRDDDDEEEEEEEEDDDEED